MGVDVVAVTETWLRPGEGDNNLVARDYSIFRMNKVHGRIRGETLMLVTQKHQAQEGHKLRTLNTHSGSHLRNWRLQDHSCGCVSYPGVDDSGGRGMVLFLSVVAVSVSMLLIVEISTPLRLTGFLRQFRKVPLGIDSCSLCTKVGWFNTISKRLGKESGK